MHYKYQLEPCSLFENYCLKLVLIGSCGLTTMASQSRFNSRLTKDYIAGGAAVGATKDKYIWIRYHKNSSAAFFHSGSWDATHWVQSQLK